MAVPLAAVAVRPGRLRGRGGSGIGCACRGAAARLAGEPVTTPWDPSLADAVARRDVRIEEELSLDTLLADLA